MSYDAWKELDMWMRDLLSHLPPDTGEYDEEEDDEDESLND